MKIKYQLSWVKALLCSIVIAAAQLMAPLISPPALAAPTPPAGFGKGSAFCGSAVPDGKDLGASFHDVYACGPANNSGTGYKVPSSGSYKGFFEAAPYSYQCTELADRILFDFWKMQPVYGANLDGKTFASTVHARYPSVQLIANGTAGKPYLPGDIVSFTGDTQEPDGHVAVVTASTENASGNGKVTIIEENAAASGQETLTVSNWKLLRAADSYVTPSDFDALASGISGPSWHTAIEVPGSSTLNQGGNAEVESVSCESAGNCSAGGFYTDASFGQQAFVAAETNGTWGTAEEVPGTAALNKGGNAQITSVSCTSLGNCSAGGDYTDASNYQRAFVVNETNGTWGTAEEVPGIAVVGQYTRTWIVAMSCTSPGNCSAAGSSFVVAETNGTWGKATVPSFKNGSDFYFNSVSCASAGNCSAVGNYEEAIGSQLVVKAFAVDQVGGGWNTGEQIPGTAAFNSDQSQVTSVSCASAGNCSADGSYVSDSSGHTQVFVVTETNGTWGTAEKVPSLAALNSDGYAWANAVACTAPGTCIAGGYYHDASFNEQAFFVAQTNGAWGAAEEVPGTAALNKFGDAYVTSISCGSAGNCSAGGSVSSQPFVIDQVNGTWDTPQEVTDNAGRSNSTSNPGITSISCASAGSCAAGGYYLDPSYHQQAFVVNRD